MIDDARLVRGLIKNLTDLSSLASEPQALAIIKSSQAIALTLWRRTDLAAAAERYGAGRRLIVEAAASKGAADLEQPRALAELLRELPEALPTPADGMVRETHFERIRQGIRIFTAGSRYPFVDDERRKALIDAMAEWERSGYALQPPPLPVISAQDRPVTVDAALLQDYFRHHRPGYEGASVSGFTPITGGFSKQTILFDVDCQGRREPLVYRGTSKIQIIEPLLVAVESEFHAVKYVCEKGAPVAEPVWLQADDGPTGTRFFLSRRMPGVNLGTAVQAYEPVPAATTRALGEALARIHSITLDADSESLRRSHLHPSAAKSSLADTIRGRVDDWRRYFRSLATETYPALELAFEWLLDNASASDDDEPVLVHGDYGLHNILIHEGRVSAVLDWEACHLGDRALDLSHILAGTADKMDSALFMDAYIGAGGRAVSQFRLMYCQVLMSMQFMLSTIDAQQIFQRRAGAGTNYCTLGLGFIEHTAQSVMNGIRRASAAKGQR